MIKATVPTAKRAGAHTSRVAVQGISHQYCTMIQCGDSYGYHQTPSIHLQGEAGQAVA